MNYIFIFFSFFLLMNASAQWTTGAGIPEGIRAGNTLSYIENDMGYIFVIGGRNDQDIISDKTYRYSFSDDSWTEMANVPTPILGASGAIIGENVYIIGGMVTTPGTVTKKVYKYSIPNDSWAQVADTPVPYTDGDAVAYQDSLIYTVGSYNSKKTLVYNIHTDEWREGTPVPSPGFALSYGALAVFENKLIYVGGSNGTFSPTYWDTVWIGEINQSDRSQITWTQGSPFPGQTRTFFEMQPWNNGLILIGGTTDNTFNTFTDENYFYNVQTDTWTKQAPKPTAWNTGNAASLFLNGKWNLFCTGGHAFEYLLNTEIYTEENLNLSEIDACHIKHAQTIGGKNPMLSFCTNASGNIDLKIWDLQGRLVKEKKSIRQHAGKHRISLNDLNLKNGLYFCQIIQNGISSTKKIHIIDK